MNRITLQSQRIYENNIRVVTLLVIALCITNIIKEVL